MNANTARKLRALFFAYVGLTFLHIAYVVNHEPFAFDAWNVAVDTHAKPATLERFFEFWYQQYTTSNPRIGQPMAYLAYKLVGVAEIGTPLAFLAIVLAGFVLGTGRRPSLQDNRDLATLAIGIGFLWFASPNFPAYMFCRAYATNYVWIAAIQLWFLVPLRLSILENARPRPPALVGYFLLGVIAGMGNEHVGPTLLVFLAGYGVWLWQRRRLRPALLWVGTLGVLVGYALIFFAPGQSQRYDGLAERYTPIQQILVRGISNNLDIYINMLEAAAPMLILVVIIVAVSLLDERRRDAALTQARSEQRRAIGILLMALAAASLITITVFASPKLGPRFYMHSMFLVMCGVLGIVRSFLDRPRAYAPFVVLAIVASTYAMLRTVPMFTRLARDSDQRLAELAAAPPGSNYTTTAWEQIPESWWFLGDDARDQKKQELIAKYFGLHRVLFRGSDRWKTLGVSDVKLTMHYEFETPICMDEIDQLDLKPYVGRDIAALHHAFLDAIAEIELVANAQLKEIDLRVTFLGSQPPMPAPTIYVARWFNEELEGYPGQIRRKGRSKVREIVLPPALQREPWDIYLALVGEPPRKLGVSTDKTPITYQPWRTGQYWALACRRDHCFVVVAVAHKA